MDGVRTARATLTGLAAAMVCGCASYSARELPGPERARFSSTMERQGITVSVEAYTDADRQRTYLGEDFGSVGAIPVLVLVENNGNHPRQLRPGSIRMRIPGGKTEKEYPSSDVSAMFVQTGGGTNPGMAFGLLGGLAVEQSKNDTVMARMDDFGRKALRRGEIKPGESWQGFVYFVLEEKPMPFTDAVLLLPLGDPAGGSAIELEVPISRIHFPSFSAR